LLAIAGFCTGSEASGGGVESGDDDHSTVGNPDDTNTFPSFEGVIDDNYILQKYPVPPLRHLDRTLIDLGTNYCEFDDLHVGSPPIVTQTKYKPHRGPKEKTRDKIPTKRNTRALNHRSKAKAREEQDDCRPDSDRHAFNSLQAAKHRARLESNPNQIAANQSNMAGKVLPTRTSKTSAKANAVNASDEENVDQKHQLSASSKRNSSTDAAIQLPVETAMVPKLPGSKPGMGMGTLSVDSLTPEERTRFDAMLKADLERDGKLSKDKRSEALKKLRRVCLILRFNNERLVAYQAEVKKLNALLDEAQQKSNARISKGKAKLLRENEDEKEKIDKLVTGELWRTCKFINCKDDEDQASEYLYKLIYGNEKKLNLDAMYSWIETYKTHIKKSLYAKRNYATSQIKNSAWNLFENNKPLPTVEMVRKCVNRTIDVNNNEEMVVFQWYWEVLLPKMVGAVEWGSNVRYYTTIYAARLPNDDRNRKLVTSSHEGMILAIWDNNFENWHELYEWSQKPENKKVKQKNSGGKYTSTNKGQRQFGGWEPHGIEAYNRYCEEASTGRKTQNRKLLEKTTLDLLRVKYNIDQPDHETQARVNRNRKRKKLSPDEAPYVAPMVRIVRTKMLQDEDESTEAEE
jgi:hypothetical protein